MQINRLFEIIYLLLQRETITAAELAERFEVSQRTIYRDVETLSAAGIPIYMKKGKGGGIALLPDFVLDKTVFTDEEKTKILSSIQAVGAVNLSGKDTVITKLGSLFGESYIDWIEVDFSSWYKTSGETELFQQLKEAICHKRTVVFKYSGINRQKSIREVEPLKLCFKGGAWYLYGYCKIRQDYRFFKLRRIKELETTENISEHKAPKRVLTQEDYFNNEYVHLKLRLSSEVSYRVYEEFEQYTELEDGSFIAETDFEKGDWLNYYISSFGRHCEVLEPAFVRDEFKKELEELVKIYS